MHNLAYLSVLFLLLFDGNIKPLYLIMCFGKIYPRVGPGCVLCLRIDPLRFLAGCRRRRLNQGLVVALGFSCC